MRREGCSYFYVGAHSSNQIHMRPERYQIQEKCPRQDSNLRSRFRKPMLYPLSYEGGTSAL
jgi:hypothetical protein